jgi:anti-sigma factor RsiW
MKRDAHKVASRLILVARIGIIHERERIWLEDHLSGCPNCAAKEGEADDTIRALRSIPVALDPALVKITRVRVQQRAAELRAQRVQQFWLWLGCILSWAWIAESAPLLWRGFSWAALKTGMPSPLWQMAFALWWVMPALVVAAALSYRSLQGADSVANGRACKDEGAELIELRGPS